MSANIITNIRIGDFFFLQKKCEDQQPNWKKVQEHWRWTVRKVRHIYAFFYDSTKLYHYAFYVKFTLGPPIIFTQCLLDILSVEEGKGIYSNWIALAKLYESQAYIESIGCIKMNTKIFLPFNRRVISSWPCGFVLT